MNRILFVLFVSIQTIAFAQTAAVPGSSFTAIKVNPITSIKNQGMTGTCWCFGTTSLVESQCIRNTKNEISLSEMFTVRNIYVEKAKNYILRQGHAQFGEGGLGHDLIRAISLYGAMPESVYTGLKENQKVLNHLKLEKTLTQYLDSTLKKMPIADNWLDGYMSILNQYLETPPSAFTYESKEYTPLSFAQQVLHFNADDYINVTSFTHQPYYKPFILQVPDNFSNGSYYNLPLDEMIAITKEAVKKGYTVMWDADVSNKGFNQAKGLALNLEGISSSGSLGAVITESPYDATIRQKLYENLTTQDDHLMHIYGIEKSPAGKDFFIVKNSWGKVGPYNGSINVSEAYFAINTVSLVIPKAALSAALLEKLAGKK